MMEDYVKFDYLDTAINNDELEAIAITAMSYASGQSVTFYQGQEKITPWNRSRRRGEKIPISIDHLMASTAIPGLFPAVKINGDYFGDGAAPVKPIGRPAYGCPSCWLLVSVTIPATASGQLTWSTHRQPHRSLAICLTAPLSMRLERS